MKNFKTHNILPLLAVVICSIIGLATIVSASSRISTDIQTDGKLEIGTTVPVGAPANSLTNGGNYFLGTNTATPMFTATNPWEPYLGTQSVFITKDPLDSAFINDFGYFNVIHSSEVGSLTNTSGNSAAVFSAYNKSPDSTTWTSTPYIQGIASYAVDNTNSATFNGAVNGAFIYAEGKGSGTSYNTIRAIDTAANVSGSATVSTLTAFTLDASASDTAHAVNAKLIDVHSMNKNGSPTIDNVYGLYIESQTAGGNNWAIKTGLGKVEFGDVVQAQGYKSADGSAGVTVSGTSCTITAIKNGIITAATCTP